MAIVGDGSRFKLELADTVGVLLRRAQSVGVVRPQLSAAIVLSLVSAAAQAAAQMNADLPELIAVISDGSRPPSAG